MTKKFFSRKSSLGLAGAALISLLSGAASAEDKNTFDCGENTILKSRFIKTEGGQCIAEVAEGTGGRTVYVIGIDKRKARLTFGQQDLKGGVFSTYTDLGDGRVKVQVVAIPQS
jgi:hypothetical protein